jgi:hypothetical protein
MTLLPIIETMTLDHTVSTMTLNTTFTFENIIAFVVVVVPLVVLTSSPVVCRREHLRNFSILQTQQLPNLTYNTVGKWIISPSYSNTEITFFFSEFLRSSAFIFPHVQLFLSSYPSAFLLPSLAVTQISADAIFSPIHYAASILFTRKQLSKLLSISISL